MLVMALLSQAGDGAADAKLVMMQCCCRVMLVMVVPRRLGRGAM
jgi:hypothetical protein